MTDEHDEMTPDEKRRDQLLRMSGSTEADAAPRIEVSEHDSVTRIDIADTAAVRPGPGPGAEDSEAAVGSSGDLSDSGREFDAELHDAEAEADDRFER